MSTRWRCAVCEAVNDGGETCAACGAKVTQTVVEPAFSKPVASARSIIDSAMRSLIDPPGLLRSLLT